VPSSTAPTRFSGTGYKDPENKLFYLGPGEGSEVTFELVKLLDPRTTK